jgi:uncharacterized membrane protein
VNECQSCQVAEKNPISGYFHARCTECMARALAQGPAFFASAAGGRFTKEYRQALRAVAGDDRDAREALHRRVVAYRSAIDAMCAPGMSAAPNYKHRWD